jgi:hypothetical protein
MAMNKLNKKFGHKKLYASLIILGAVIIIVALILVGSPARNQTKHQTNNSSASKQSSLTAGGVKVPMRLQARARAAGYYCLSWNTSPGTIEPDICMTLDKTN